MLNSVYWLIRWARWREMQRAASAEAEADEARLRHDEAMERVEFYDELSNALSGFFPWRKS